MNNVDIIKNKEDIDKIKKILIQSSYRNYLMFVIGINTGLRISQILGLKTSDLITDSKRIKDNVYFNNICYPFNDLVKNEIISYLIKNKYNSNEDIYIFKSKKGDNPIERTQAYRILKKACKKAGVDINFGTHTLRKTFGYHFYLQFKDVKYLQKLFNHSSVQTTLNYIGLKQENDGIEYEAFKL